MNDVEIREGCLSVVHVCRREIDFYLRNWNSTHMAHMSIQFFGYEKSTNKRLQDFGRILLFLGPAMLWICEDNRHFTHYDSLQINIRTYGLFVHGPFQNTHLRATRIFSLTHRQSILHTHMKIASPGHIVMCRFVNKARAAIDIQHCLLNEIEVTAIANKTHILGNFFNCLSFNHTQWLQWTTTILVLFLSTTCVYIWMYTMEKSGHFRSVSSEMLNWNINWYTETTCIYSTASQ